MRLAWIIFAAALVCLTLAVVVWLGGRAIPADPEPSRRAASAGEGEPLRIALIPERDIFEQRRRYRALADHIAERLNRPVELVTNNTYQGVLDDFADGRVDAAFLGSFVAVLAMDRHDARVLVKPEMPGGITAYRGVLFTRAASPIESVDDLVGRSIATVKATTAGDLFPVHELSRRGLLDGAEAAQLRWVGTHDAVIHEVVEGRADAGAAKDLRLAAYEAAHPVARLRRLAVGEAVPNNALVAHATLPEPLAEQIAATLLDMHETSGGRATLEAFGAVRFVRCTPEEYVAIYEMVATLGEHWSDLGVEGPPPGRRESPVVRGEK